MSQHPSSSGSKSSQHAKTSPMEFVDEDVMDVTPLCMIPGDTTGTSSNAGDKQGNTSGNSSLPKDMYFTDRAIRRLVTRILSEGHKVEGVSTPLSRREPFPEGEPHADKDDDSSRSEKEVAAEGLCSLGKTLPNKKQNVPQENIIDLEEESTEGEDDPLVHLVKPSIAEKLRTKKGKSMAKMRAARVKKTAGIRPSKPWSKVEVGKRKERDSSDSKEDVKDDRRLAIERELGQEAVEVKKVIEMIKNAGLMKTVVTLPQCYEGLVKEFIVNIPEDIHDKNSREFCKECENKKCNPRSLCYNYGKEGHYRSECPMKKKHNEKGHHKKSRKFRRAYVACENESDALSDKSSTSSEESTRIFLMENKKKKKVISHSNLESTHALSYYQF
ncbi:uncharacterized protein LOC127103141 [Lathyrus oleraceus]|uniref:uncharacterized protein LOC127103141 n=1 Tax=Pisum sativum TaxID=3888 RepID=UPI0021D051FE|nr:uncharacterized protein LOC127103141 [Pisum sativum]